MLTPGEIYSNLDDLAANPPAGGEFGLALMEAVGAPRSTITKLRDTAAAGDFTWTRMLRFEATEPGGADAALDRMRAEVEAAPKGRRPRVLLAYDGERIAAFDTSPRFDEEPLRVGLDMLSLEGDVFFPLGGHERYVPKKERMADVRATRFISRFHDAVRDANPLWTTEVDRHALNIFMARVLFCLFSDDVGNLSDRLGPDGAMTWTAPAGDWVIVRIGHTSMGKKNMTAPVSGQGHEVDKLDPALLKAYWDTFPAELLRLAGPHVGKTFVHIEIDSFEMGDQNWTGIMPAEFSRRRGYDILPMLLVVTGRTVESKDVTARFRYDWTSTVHEMFIENYFQAMQALVHRAPGMELLLEPYSTGHGQPFESLNAGIAADLPMAEFWQKPTPWGWNTNKPVVSGAHIWGKNVIAAEAFTGQPNSAWRVDPYALKSTGDRAFCDGINKFYFHTSAHQPWKTVLPGMTMGQWGTHFGRTQTWWDHGGPEWIRYLARSQFLLQHGRPVADLLYLAYDRLTPKPIPGFWAETIGTYAFVSRLSVKDGLLVLPNGLSYKVLILPNTGVMRADVAAKLKELVEAGAKVVGPPPTTSPGLADRQQADALVASVGRALWSGRYTGQVLNQPIEQALKTLAIEPDLDIVSTDATSPLLWIHRRSETEEIYLISNQTDLVAKAEISLPDMGRVAELWDADTGLGQEAPYQFVQGGRRLLRLDLAPSGSTFIILRCPAQSAVTARALTPPTPDSYSTLSDGRLLAAQNGEFTVTLGDGAVRRVSVKGVAEPFAITTPWELTFADRTTGVWRTLFDGALPSWTEFEDDTRYYSGTATYETEFSFPRRLARDSVYVLDLGTVHNIARVRLNGRDLRTLWKPPFRLDITAALRGGRNALEIEVTNLWANRMIGDERFPDDLQWTGKSLSVLPDWIDTGSPRPEPRRKTFATYKFFDGKEALLPSGLMGPVTIRQLRRRSLA